MKNETRILMSETKALSKNIAVLGATGVASAATISMSKSCIQDIVDKKNRQEKKKKKKKKRNREKFAVKGEQKYAKKVSEETGRKIPVKMKLDWMKRKIGSPSIPMIDDMIKGTIDNSPKIAKTTGKIACVGGLAILTGALGNESKSRVKESLESITLMKNISKEMYREYTLPKTEE